MSDIIPQGGRLGRLLEAGHTLAYAEAAGGGVFADLLDASGRRVECGLGADQAEALVHLAGRLERREVPSGEEPATVSELAALEGRVEALESKMEWRSDLLLKTLAHALRVPPYLSEEGLLLELLGAGALVEFGRDADGSYFAGVDAADGAHRDGRGESPAAALRDARDSEDEPDMQPYCKTCGEPVSIFHGHEGWHHFRGEGTPESRTELYDAGHEPAVAWREPDGAAQ